MRHRRLLAPEDAAEQRASLARLGELAVEYVREKPRATARELARHLTVVALRAEREDRAEIGLEGPADRSADLQAEEGMGQLEATLQMMREEVLESVARIGGRLVSCAWTPTWTSLMGWFATWSCSSSRLCSSARPGRAWRRRLPTSTPACLPPRPRCSARSSRPPRSTRRCSASTRRSARQEAIAPRGEPSLGPFLPRKGTGLALSASDIETYRSCPLRYKFARVLRIPTEQTLHQRFGIVVHQVLERYHSASGETLAQLLELLDAGWRRGGFGDSEQEHRLREKARAALDALPRAAARAGLRACVVRALVRLPARAPPSARARRPRRPSGGGGGGDGR